jgi:hypothetical protein
MKKSILFILAILEILILTSCTYERNNPLDPGGTSYKSDSTAPAGVTDGPDVEYGGETYKTVVLGGQTWFARNLNFEPQAGNSWPNAPYGRFYDWNTALGVCPEGWHLPSSDEWNALARSEEWRGFLDLLGGYRSPVGTIDYAGQDGYWWSATEADSSDASVRYIYSGADALHANNLAKTYGASVRCVK